MSLIAAGSEANVTDRPGESLSGPRSKSRTKIGFCFKRSLVPSSATVGDRWRTSFARNPYNTEFADRVAFFDVDDAARTVSADRTEFLGRNGTLRSPAAMTRSRLSGKVGAALDPCAAVQVPSELADGQEREFIFRLGVGRNTHNAVNLVHRFRGSGSARGALEAVWELLEAHARRGECGNSRPVP